METFKKKEEQEVEEDEEEEEEEKEDNEGDHDDNKISKNNNRNNKNHQGNANGGGTEKRGERKSREDKGEGKKTGQMNRSNDDKGAPKNFAPEKETNQVVEDSTAPHSPHIDPRLALDRCVTSAASSGSCRDDYDDDNDHYDSDSSSISSKGPLSPTPPEAEYSRGISPGEITLSALNIPFASWKRATVEHPGLISPGEIMLTPVGSGAAAATFPSSTNHDARVHRNDVTEEVPADVTAATAAAAATAASTSNDEIGGRESTEPKNFSRRPTDQGYSYSFEDDNDDDDDDDDFSRRHLHSSEYVDYEESVQVVNVTIRTHVPVGEPLFLLRVGYPFLKEGVFMSVWKSGFIFFISLRLKFFEVQN